MFCKKTRPDVNMGKTVGFYTTCVSKTHIFNFIEPWVFNGSILKCVSQSEFEKYLGTRTIPCVDCSLESWKSKIRVQCRNLVNA